MIRFLTFEQIHNKKSIGSTHIRVHQLLKYWKEADIYKYGENPDVLVFQKVYSTPDYKFHALFEGKKILDICDADWLWGQSLIKETIDHMDAVTCPTENLAKFLRQLTDKPVKVIKDRFDMEEIPKPKIHTERAKTIAWFGYRHNGGIFKPAINIIEELKLNIIAIADDDPAFFTWSHRDRKDFYTFVKYKEETFYEELQKADFVVFPPGTRPQDHFKSENKTIKSILAGLPVATNREEVIKFLSPKERQKHIDSVYDKIKKEYDVRQSVKEMKELINEIKANGR